MLKQEKPFSLALVTGASSGIGAALCRLLAQKGIPLLMIARDKSRLEQLAHELSVVPVTVLAADLATDEGRGKVVAAIHQYMPDLVVNNAGFGFYGEALAHPTNENLEMVDLNIKALLALTLEAARMLISEGKKGTILNISSASDLLVFPGFAVYAATKAFVTQFSQSMDVEVKPKGVRVLVACPGVVRTAFRKRASGTEGVPSGPGAMDVNFAAQQLWQQIEKGRGLHYFDFKTRVLIFLARFVLPRSLVNKFLFKTVLAYTSRKPYNKND